MGDLNMAKITINENIKDYLNELNHDYQLDYMMSYGIIDESWKKNVTK